MREIMDDPDALYAALERVRVRLPPDWHSSTDWSTLAGDLAEYDSALAIVNTRKDAHALWEQMQKYDQGTLHLSALMCGAHRSQVIADIEMRLQAGSDGQDGSIDKWLATLAQRRPAALAHA
ncbi:hypothetical protein [Acidithiobacillus ferrooxidans]|uniref:hypothetical protein n=2 Tax=Acidithiobacillus ferrooxidans TaxID=920 RepID=UPI001C06F71B|nr:hypothetical protein [Acidithiobacillus ferrooxidans]